MDDSGFAQRVAAVRRFNRFYTRRIGVLLEGHLSSPYSLTEVRVIYELAHRDETTATALAKYLDLDPGYLSRLLRKLANLGQIEKTPSTRDGRQSLLRLTDSGRGTFAMLNARSAAEIGAMLDELSPPEQTRLIEAMGIVEEVLGAEPEPKAPYLLRPHQPGDIGWVIQRHGVLYAREFGWDERFEALVAGVAAAFVENFDSQTERCWIAEKDGENVGSVFLARQSDEVAKLRLLLVEPKARGLGIGRRLVDECIRFARSRGYKTMTLWTNSVLTAARQIYRDAGFRMVHSEPHRSFGQDLVSETWELDLRAAAGAGSPGQAR